MFFSDNLITSYSSLSGCCNIVMFAFWFVHVCLFDFKIDIKTNWEYVYVGFHIPGIVSWWYDVDFFRVFFPQVRLNLGIYSVFLLDWLTVFQRDQIIVLRLEDYAANIKATIKKIFDFLSVGMCP